MRLNLFLAIGCAATFVLSLLAGKVWVPRLNDARTSGW